VFRKKLAVGETCFMSVIDVRNLTFCYSGSFDNIFENVSFTVDTDWKLGFIGRNGKGKTTFLNLLMNKFEYSGTISSSVSFDYFPFKVKDKSKSALRVVGEIYPDCEYWKLCRELNLLDLSTEILERSFESLSGGEQSKLMLSILFSKENNFFLIDEPTNHLDANGRKKIAAYLNNKRGFILVSHDRAFLDSCIDHVLSVNKMNIEIQRGNFSSWWQNKKNQDNFEIAEDVKLKKDIKRLEKSARQTSDWSDKVEKTKNGIRVGGLKPDKGRIGHKAAKMMKRSKCAESRKNKAFEDKSKLLKNIEISESLKLSPLVYHKNRLIEISNLCVFYGKNKVCENINFTVENGDRIQIKGRNGCGKSSILKLILGEDVNYLGRVDVPKNLKISYVSQYTSHLKGNLADFTKSNNVNESLFKTILRKLNFSRIQLEKDIENLSEGQKKKVLIAKSLCDEADLYIWDEPLNFIDVLSRIQIEDLILKYKPTMIFVEHDKMFSDKIKNKSVDMIL
jgi:lincosamide and streptogramin A transport system ATP-binding/permease protein